MVEHVKSQVVVVPRAQRRRPPEIEAVYAQTQQALLALGLVPMTAEQQAQLDTLAQFFGAIRAMVEIETTSRRR